jgi:glycosyltransferase involved in cell wall biosynthesis
MKILHIINTLSPAGAETLLSTIVPLIKNKGIDIEIATLFCYDNKSLFNSMRAQNIKIHSFNYRFRYDIRIVWSIKSLIKAGNYDIIHAHLFPAFYWLAFCNPPRCKLVASEHSSYNTRRSIFLFKFIERFIYNRYDSVFCISKSVYNALSQWLPECSNRFVTNYNGIDLAKFVHADPLKRASLQLPPAGKIGAMVSRIDSAKDQKTIVEALNDIPDLHILFVGDGSTVKLKEFAMKLGVLDRIHFLGYRSDIPSILKLCDIYIHSSNWEGFGLAVVEAMACGIPAIVSNIEGLNEIVQDNVSGLLFKRGDYKDLAAKIHRIFKDTNLYNALKAQGLKRAQDFSVVTTVDNFILQYNNLCEK